MCLGHAANFEVAREVDMISPHDFTHWSVSLMAKYAGVTTWQVRQIWKAAGLKAELQRCIRVHNRDLAKPFKWTKSADTYWLPYREPHARHNPQPHLQMIITIV